MKALTHDGEVERGLALAVAVLQLHGVAATVLLLARGDEQPAAAVSALDAHAPRALLDLRTASEGSLLIDPYHVLISLYSVLVFIVIDHEVIDELLY